MHQFNIFLYAFAEAYQQSNNAESTCQSPECSSVTLIQKSVEFNKETQGGVSSTATAGISVQLVAATVLVALLVVKLKYQ